MQGLGFKWYLDNTMKAYYLLIKPLIIFFISLNVIISDILKPKISAGTYIITARIIQDKSDNETINFKIIIIIDGSPEIINNLPRSRHGNNLIVFVFNNFVRTIVRKGTKTKYSANNVPSAAPAAPKMLIRDHPNIAFAVKYNILDINMYLLFIVA